MGNSHFSQGSLAGVAQKHSHAQQKRNDHDADVIVLNGREKVQHDVRAVLD